MKGMKDAVEFQQPAPPGQYLAKLVLVEAQVSKIKTDERGNQKGGETMLHLTAEIVNHPQFTGQQADDYIGTDGTTRWGGRSKAKLRGLLGDQAVSTNDELPDAVIAQNLLGQIFLIDFGNEPLMGKNEATGKFDKPITFIDPRTNGPAIAQKLTIMAYRRQTPAAQPQAPQQIQQGYAPQQGQGFVPPGYPTQQAPQQAPQGLAPQYAPQPGFAPQQFAPAPFPQQTQYAQPPQGLAPQAPQYAQAPVQQLAPQGQQIVAPAQGQMPWQGAPANGQAPGQPQAEAEPAKSGGRRRVKIEDAPQGQG